MCQESVDETPVDEIVDENKRRSHGVSRPKSFVNISSTLRVPKPVDETLSVARLLT